MYSKSLFSTTKGGLTLLGTSIEPWCMFSCQDDEDADDVVMSMMIDHDQWAPSIISLWPPTAFELNNDNWEKKVIGISGGQAGSILSGT